MVGVEGELRISSTTLGGFWYVSAPKSISTAARSRNWTLVTDFITDIENVM
jgi:hypothetical protein